MNRSAQYEHRVVGARLHVIVLVVSTLTLAGCGGNGESSSESYANDIYESMSAWITALADADTRLSKSSLSAATLEDAAEDAKGAANRLLNELDQLESPETEEGEETDAKIDEFAGELRGQVTVIEQTLDSNIGPAARVETVSIVVFTAVDAGRLLVDELRRQHPGSELTTTFRESSECQSLKTRISDLES